MTTWLIALLIVVGLLAAALVALWLFGERGHLMLPSTRRALGLGRAKPRGAATRPQPSAAPTRRKTNWHDALHAYVYGRWTNQYIGVMLNWLMPRLSPAARARWANSYHGKVLTPELAAEIITLDHDIDARHLEHIVPYPVARDLILKSPVHITLYECACRHARPNGGCKPSDVCMTIGSPTHDFLIEHNPHSARRITQAEALDLLRAEHERGHLHSAWFKDVMGDRFFAICNCCKCCCGGIEAMVKYGTPTMVSSGYVAAIDAGNCTACGSCIAACPFDALALDGRVVVNRDKCMGCGVCQSQCAFEAIALVRDETKPAPLDVRAF